MTAPGRLLLLGTIHRDPAGSDKLERSLAEHQPAIVTVEVSAYGVQFREQRATDLLAQLYGDVATLAQQLGRRFEELKQHPAISCLRAAVELPFEWQAATRWAREHDAACHAIDDDAVSRHNLDLLVREALPIDNLRRLLTDEASAAAVSERVIEQELLARRYLRVPDLFHLHFRDAEKAEIAARDRAMAARIRELLESRPEATLAHVCGWEHLVVSPHLETIARRLDDLAPRRELIR
jgi:pheromone shutdown protein TraB